MKKDLLFYYAIVALFFVVILFSVRYIVNTTRVFVGYEESVNPVEIKWQVDESDSVLRIQEPLYLANNYYICKSQTIETFTKNDSVIVKELFSDSTVNKGSVLNLKPPYVVWKNPKNDTLKVFKNEKTLRFVKAD
ncbi:MAG: hypothetical protein KIG88_03115 [Weeksellaceae bacterium]|nr:hypothetical protein [Weeksellaceae bacterium]